MTEKEGKKLFQNILFNIQNIKILRLENKKFSFKFRILKLGLYILYSKNFFVQFSRLGSASDSKQSYFFWSKGQFTNTC